MNATETNWQAFPARPDWALCPGCCKTFEIGKVLKHSYKCDIAPEQKILTGEVGTPVLEVETKTAPVVSKATIRRFKTGCATEADRDEALDLVASGHISVSDAMNQDF